MSTESSFNASSTRLSGSSKCEPIRDDRSSTLFVRHARERERLYVPDDDDDDENECEIASVAVAVVVRWWWWWWCVVVVVVPEPEQDDDAHDAVEQWTKSACE